MVCWNVRHAHYQKVGLLQIPITYYDKVKSLRQHVQPLDESQRPSKSSGHNPRLMCEVALSCVCALCNPNAHKFGVYGVPCDAFNACLKVMCVAHVRFRRSFLFLFIMTVPTHTIRIWMSYFGTIYTNFIHAIPLKETGVSIYLSTNLLETSQVFVSFAENVRPESVIRFFVQ